MKRVILALIVLVPTLSGGDGEPLQLRCCRHPIIDWIAHRRLQSQSAQGVQVGKLDGGTRLPRHEVAVERSGHLAFAEAQLRDEPAQRCGPVSVRSPLTSTAIRRLA